MYKTLHVCAPEFLRTSFTFTSEIHSRILRSTCPLQLYSPKPRSELYKRSFQYPGVSIWNNLPVYVQHSPSVNVFKARYLKWGNIRAYLSNSVFLFSRYFLMVSSCIVHCNTVFLYIVLECMLTVILIFLSVYLFLYLVQFYC